MSNVASKLLNQLEDSNHISHEMAVDLSRNEDSLIVPSLLERSVSPEHIADVLIKIFDWTSYSSANEENIIEKKKEYVVTDSCTYVVNPLDTDMMSEIARTHKPKNWGILIHSSSHEDSDLDIDDVEFSSEESQAFISKIITYAVARRSSDIHIEPDHQSVTVKIRVDGKLQSVPQADIKHGKQYLSIANFLLTKAKKTAGTYISPVDSEITWDINEGRTVQLRLSMVPATVKPSIAASAGDYPGAFVMRIAGQDGGLAQLDKIGLSDSQLEDLKHVLKSPHGIFCVTGPTGSGKTTTLYASLRYLQNLRPNWAFRTVEDPVEVNLRGITQTATNKDANTSFGSVLKSLLRQDPDVIMIGEIRDEETLKIALEAAMTGHFVITTLHANGALQAIHRLIMKGAEPDVLADVLIATSAQRVVPKLCQNCSQLTPISECVNSDKESKLLISKGITQARVANKKGCNHCTNGYQGRQLICEINRPSRNQAKLISQNKPLFDIKECADKQGFKSMWDSAINLIQEGVIDFASADFALGDLTQTFDK